MNAAEFVTKWNKVDLSERSAAQQHFLDLCELLAHPKPAGADPTGESFTFERGAAKHGGGDGWADVWKKGFFGWEYKGKHKDLAAAYDQLLQYRADLENPPLLIVCDMDRIVVHTNFERAKEQVFEIPLAALDSPRNLEILRAVFHDPDRLRPGEPSRAVTEEAAARLGELAALMGKRGLEPHAVAHYLIRLVFCLFAEDVDLLPRGLFAEIVKQGRSDPARFSRMVSQLFAAMAAGGEFGADVIKHFNGNLFADTAVLDLTRDEIERVATAAALEWSAVDASIFGTLFTRGIDPQQRAQLGAQYTSRADIETIVEPVVMVPLRREWAEVRAKAEALLGGADKNVGGASAPRPEGEASVPQQRSRGAEAPPTFEKPAAIKKSPSSKPNTPTLQHSSTPSRKSRAAAEKLLTAFLERLKHIRVLDSAGGSGNFLYVTLQRLLDLEKEVNDYLAAHGFTPHFPQVNPGQLHLIEINTYAHSLAQVTVQIGYIQWLRAHGYGFPAEPILLRLDQNFQLRDAIVDCGNPVAAVCDRRQGTAVSNRRSANDNSRRSQTAATENSAPRIPDWPEVDFIVSNPPFLGGKKLRTELGDEYVEKLFAAWKDAVPPEADFCCYWFEKARQHLAAGKVKRVGLLATQGIRGGASREVLKRIKDTGDIFFAESDRDWILDGANVHVSMIGFDKGEDKERKLDGKAVPTINPNLTATADITQAGGIAANLNIAFMGTTKGGAFDIPESFALELLRKPNPHGRPNSDVVVPWVNGMDLTKRSSGTWIIDFGLDMIETEAAKYEAVFEYVRTTVKPQRDKSRSTIEEWWLHERRRGEMRTALAPQARFICTTRVSKHRLFVWLQAPTLPDSATFAFARSDDYFFGVLHSRAHEVWALKLGTRLETRPRYTPTTCFETFPFPGSAGVPPADGAAMATPPPAGKMPALPGEHIAAIAAAAKELNELRERWLNPPEWTREEVLEFPASSDGPWARYVANVGGASAPRPEGEASTPQQQSRGAEAPPTFQKPAIGVARYPRLVPKDEASAKLLAKRTLTNLYNERPTWLANAHAKLDAAVSAAYGWPSDLTDEQILEKLLALNLERAGNLARSK